LEGAPPIKVNAEAAVIVWDEAHGTENYIRRANFDSSGKSMGFLVPTPDTPTIAAAADGIFSSLDNAMVPRTVTRVRAGYRFDWLLLPDKQEPAVQRTSYVPDFTAPVASKGAKSGTVSTAAVGGYTATILPALIVGLLLVGLGIKNFNPLAVPGGWIMLFGLVGFKFRD
jgi:hypothetical protein